MRLDAATIARATGGRVVRGAGAGPVLTDTRTLTEGSWFLAIRGERFDGHDFLERATAGAAGCIVDTEPESSWTGGVVVVPDTTRALQDLGRWARDQLLCPVVGLTGSSGKTTTRALLALALSPLGEVHQTAGNLNNHLGLPMTLLAAPDWPDAVVLEMGTSSPGEISSLADIARPDMRLVVNVGPAHLQELGGLEGVAHEKGTLFASARPGDILLVNVDDPFVRAMERPEGTLSVSWGHSEEAEVRLVDARVDGIRLCTTARYAWTGGEAEVEIPAPGWHVALDGAGALAAAVALGVDPAAAVAAMSRYEPVGMRLRAVQLPGGAVVLNDAYNANPASVRSSVDMLAALPGRRLAVLGDMLELGTHEARLHAEVAAHAVEAGLDLVVLVGERMAPAAPQAPRVHAFSDPLDAVPLLAQWLVNGDRVLLKGSRGARLERILHALQHKES